MAVTGPSSKMKRRMMVCMAVLCCASTLGLMARLFTLQVMDVKSYRKDAAKQQLRTTEISAKRGTIYDRNMKTLAQSASVWTVFISPKDIYPVYKKDEKGKILKDEDGEKIIETSTDEVREQLAQGLSEILGVDKEKIVALSRRDTYYEIVKRRVERAVADEVLKFAEENNLVCINLEEDNKRYYPYGSLASTVLGFTGSENHGAYGLEAKYDDVLSGTPGRVVSAKNAWGTDMDQFKYKQMYNAENGNSIVLTIDETIQHFVEKYVEIAVQENNVKNRASCIVMDVNTGDILAMATEGDFDPNDPYTIADPVIQMELDAAGVGDRVAAMDLIKRIADTKVRAELTEKLQKGEDIKNDLYLQMQYNQWRNKAISDPYEPGSVFKLITAAAALEEGTSRPSDTFDCPGYIMVGKTRYGCWATDGRHGHQDFTQIMMHSCNPGFITVGLRLGPESFWKYYQGFGLTEKTGVDLPGEAGNAGLFHTLETLKSSDVYLASEAFGQTDKVTPIQLITAISAVVNGGKLMQPRMVKQVLDADGNIIENIEPVVKRQVISEETSKVVRLMAEQVVGGVGGSGKNAYIPGFRVGGKTGTSEQLDKTAEDGQVKIYTSSFLGFAPADNPQVACLLMMDNPYMPNPYGSVYAAPVVGAILGDVLPYLGVEPQYTDAELANVDVKVPNVIGNSTLEAQGMIRPMGLEYEMIGDGNTVIKQTPRALTSVPKGSKVLLYTDTQELNALTTVPDLVGMTAAQANVALGNAKLNIKLTGVTQGANKAAKQSVEAGTQAEPGTVITVQFISTETSD